MNPNPTPGGERGPDAAPAAAPAERPTFDALALSSDVRKAIDTLGYLNPTPVQLAVFEPASRGKNLVVQARTGTGKTAAFGLPIIDALVKRGEAHVQALILSPTRELALQISRELGNLAQFRGTKITAVYGGAPMGKQIDDLQGGAQVVVGTPGRVLDHIRRGTLDTSNIRIFVLDEADEMLSMGFAKELNAIIGTLPKERQGLYFSATIPPDVERLAQSHLRDPEWITLSSDSIGALEIAHYVYLVREGDKRAALVRIIEVEDPESAIIFCNTKDETERVAEALKNRGWEADWLNGDLEQKERERVMAATREGKLRFLVCTDVAARGIDISHLTHVINADFPESAEYYVHRTGRTGRAGKTGTAISLVGPKDVGHLYMLRLTYKIRPIERTLPTAGELKTRAEADLVTFLQDAYAGQPADPMHVAVARRLLTHEGAEKIIAGLLRDHLGASPDAEKDAAEARRAKNPPPVAPPARDREPPRTLRDGERPAGGREDRPRDGRGGRGDRDRRDRRDDRRPEPRAEAPRAEGRPEPRAEGRPEPRAEARPAAPRGDARNGSDDRGRGRRPGMPHRELTSWEPKVDEDDDAPILGYTVEGESRPEPPAREARTGGRDDRRGGRDRGGREREHGRGARDGRPADRERPAEASSEAVTAERGPAPSSRGGEDPASEVPDDFANLFLNVGRRDGLTPEEIAKLLGDLAGIGPADTGRIHIRDRISFVSVKKEQADKAIQALVGQTVGGRTVNVEIARAR